MKALAFNEEIEVEINNFICPVVGDYAVFSDGKIWKAVSSSGGGRTYKITYEREFSNEKITLLGFTAELKQMKKLIRPSGYIKL